MDCDLHAGGEKMEKINIQDKVNYAVSEMKARVTDLTMLTRTGCTGMYLASTGLQLGCTELLWAVVGSSGLYFARRSCTGLY